MSVRSYHRTKSVARSEAQKWKNRGYKVFIEHPQRKSKKGDYRVVTEGYGSKKKKGHIVDVTKTQR